MMLLCMVTDVNETSCGNHFPMYTNIESMCYIPETNIMLKVNYTVIKNKNVVRC